MYGIENHYLEHILLVFSKYDFIEKAILYGSRAKGNYRLNSDIDITLVGPKIDLNLLLNIENKLDDLLLPYQIDLSIFHKIDNKDLIDHIKRVGVVIYDTTKSPS